METSGEYGDELAPGSCLERDECVESLVADAPPDCIYCRMKLLDHEEMEWE